MKLISQVLALSLLFFVFVACSSTPPAPNLAALYDRSAKHHGIDRNPVIVIPGILGSRLVVDETEQVVWGAFGGGYADPTTPEGMRLISLPLEPGTDLSDLSDNVRPDGALEQVKVDVLGLPVSLSAYKEILETLGAGGYRDEQLAMSGAVDYGPDHFTCFQFDYDWRYDVSHSAAKLHEYIKEKQKYVADQYRKRFGIDNPDIKFDIVAHSMGGLVARYFLRYGSGRPPADGSLPTLNWEGANYVDRVILVGTPNAGSNESYAKLRSGAKYSPIHPRYPAALLATLPSLYGLLPRPRHRAVIDADTKMPLDIYDAALWEEQSWGLFSKDGEEILEAILPEEANREQRRAIAREHLEKILLRTAQIHRALDLPARPPMGVSLSLLAGDAIPTDSVTEVSLNSGDYEVTTKGPGDGTVLRSSALLDERKGNEWKPRLVTPLHWRNVTFLFTDHLEMTKDPSFTDNVLYTLLEAPN